MTRPTRTNTADAAVPHARPAPEPAGDATVPGDEVAEVAGVSGVDGAAGTEPVEAEEAHRASWELVHAAQAGDTVAFGKLYDRYVDVVFRYVLFRVGDRELAEDVTSETFLRALRRITSVSYQGRDVGAWFVTIARNLVLDHVKSSRYRLEVTTPEFRDSERDEAGPEQQVMSRVTRDALLECVDQLGDDQRECIVLRFLQGLSVAETAEIMNRNEGAVKALQHRAVRRLAQLLPTELR